MRRWTCHHCWYIYAPRVGDPDRGIAPGTPLKDIPEDRRCPVCGASRADFYQLDPEPVVPPLPLMPMPPAAAIPPVARPAAPPAVRIDCSTPAKSADMDSRIMKGSQAWP
ncbi:MAG: rubredoxin [Myxococcales bacterium]|nr:rubredoxin [Myxococcota bacterium]MDW8282569.1 rubredoxin [Myxococcales bacterium]